MPRTFRANRPGEVRDSRQLVTTIGAYLTAKGNTHATAPRPAGGSSLSASCAWLGDTQVIKSANRMFVDDHPSRRLSEPSQ
jgi:hypothetical protein